ncbi:hypothetical protein C5167_023596 [Papaver somniferum]|uniref:AP2/ERF domain-containing protein n=1 Tax=Papaver somniferum TaxID=3469 RepID=A0A4Y7JQ35_PAPSO|nr:hypothetical protein C5167_023596 [Papaver somniferum]
MPGPIKDHAKTNAFSFSSDAGGGSSSRRFVGVRQRDRTGDGWLRSKASFRRLGTFDTVEDGMCAYGNADARTNFELLMDKLIYCLLSLFRQK